MQTLPAGLHLRVPALLRVDWLRRAGERVFISAPLFPWRITATFLNICFPKEQHYSSKKHLFSSGHALRVAWLAVFPAKRRADRDKNRNLE